MSESRAPSWRMLYNVGGAAALIAAMVFRRNISAELVMLQEFGLIEMRVPGIPIEAADWLALYRADVWLGLVLGGLLDLVNYVLVGLALLALYRSLRRVAPNAMTIVVACGLVGVGMALASNQSFAMLSLSEQYAAATAAAQRENVLVAAEALLDLDNPGIPQQVSGVHGALCLLVASGLLASCAIRRSAAFDRATAWIGVAALAISQQGSAVHGALYLVTVGGLIASCAMRRSEVFDRTTAGIGIAAHGILLTFFPIIAWAPALSFAPPSLSAIPLLIWYMRVARRLFALARQG